MSTVCALRDFLLFTLSISSFHQTLHIISEPGAITASHSSMFMCPIMQSALTPIFLLLVVVTSGGSLAAYSRGWSNCNRVSWGVDAVGLIPGMFFQVMTRPQQWMSSAHCEYSPTCPPHSCAAANQTLPYPLELQLCTVEHSPLANSMFMLGEWLVYGTMLRLVLSADFGRRFVPSLIVISQAVVVTGGMYYVAAILREHMGCYTSA